MITERCKLPLLRNFYVLYQKAIWTLITSYRWASSASHFSYLCLSLINNTRPGDGQALFLLYETWLSQLRHTLKELKKDFLRTGSKLRMTWTLEFFVLFSFFFFLDWWKFSFFLLFFTEKFSLRCFFCFCFTGIFTHRSRIYCNFVSSRFSLVFTARWKTGLNQFCEKNPN